HPHPPPLICHIPIRNQLETFRIIRSVLSEKITHSISEIFQKTAATLIANTGLVPAPAAAGSKRLACISIRLPESPPMCASKKIRGKQGRTVCGLDELY